jgi:ribonucleoside-diphosphate reductase alpha chain
MIRVYAIVQKWTDQAISADLFVNLQGDQKVSSSNIVQDYLDMVKYGMKSRYYVNSLTGGGIDLKSTESAVGQEVQEAVTEDERGCASGVCSL